MSKVFKRPKSIGATNFKTRTMEQKHKYLARNIKTQEQWDAFLESMQPQAQGMAVELLRPYLRDGILIRESVEAAVNEGT